MVLESSLRFYNRSRRKYFRAERHKLNASFLDIRDLGNLPISLEKRTASSVPFFLRLLNRNLIDHRQYINLDEIQTGHLTSLHQIADQVQRVELCHRQLFHL